MCVGSLVVKGCRSGALAAPQWSVAIASAGREWLKLDQGWQINIDVGIKSNIKEKYVPKYRL